VRQKPFVFNGLRSYAQSVRVCDSRLKGRLAAMFPAGCRGKNQAHPKGTGAALSLQLDKADRGRIDCRPPARRRPRASSQPAHRPSRALSAGA